MKYLWVFLFAALAMVANSRAQVCLRYEQGDSCRSYPITDFTISALAGESVGSPARHLDLATNLGWLFEVNERLALGPSFFLSVYRNGGWHSQLGLSARLRIYLGKKFHADISPGVILHDSPFPEGFSGYNFEAGLGYRDWVSIVTRVDVVKVYPEDRDTIVQFGVKFGSYAGLALTGAGAVAGGIGYLLGRMD